LHRPAPAAESAEGRGHAQDAQGRLVKHLVPGRFRDFGVVQAAILGPQFDEEHHRTVQLAARLLRVIQGADALDLLLPGIEIGGQRIFLGARPDELLRGLLYSSAVLAISPSSRAMARADRPDPGRSPSAPAKVVR
jgi:hypothetical protein